MNYIKHIRKKVGHDPIFAPAAGCIIIKNNKILLQKRKDDNKWALHGGYLELGETFYQAMKRKVTDEINIKPLNPRLVDIYSGESMHDVYPNGDEVFGVVAIYIAYDYEGEFKYNPEDVSELKWFDINNLPKDIHNTDKKPIEDAILFYSKNDNE